MSDDTTSDQRGSNVVGGQAGRDIHNNYYNTVAGTRPSQLTRLLKSLTHEIENSVLTSDFVDELQFFIDNRSGEKVVGLQNKLEASGQETRINDAKKKKELFVKLLVRLERFSSAQHLFAYIMALIYEAFETKILPHIDTLAPAEIDGIIQSEVFDRVMVEIGEGSEHFTFNVMHLRGMTYWLADKCYVRWHND